MGLELYADDVGGNFYELVYLDWDCLHNILGEKVKRKQELQMLSSAVFLLIVRSQRFS